jgi:hypothetical protein
LRDCGDNAGCGKVLQVASGLQTKFSLLAGMLVMLQLHFPPKYLTVSEELDIRLNPSPAEVVSLSPSTFEQIFQQPCQLKMTSWTN